MTPAPQSGMTVPRVTRKTRRAKPSGSASAATPDAAHYAALIKALGGIVYDWRPKAGVLRWVGDFTQILGYSAAEMGSGTASWTTRVHPEDLPRVLAEVESAHDERRLYDLEYRFLHRDGHYCWMHDRGVLFPGTDGTLERIVGVFRDISTRKHAEEGLRASERIRRLIIDTEPECVKLVSPTGALLQMNPAGLSMLEAPSLEQAQARGLINFVRPEHREAFAGLHQRVIGGAEGSLEFEVEGLRGTRRWLETRAVPLRDERGAVEALLGVTRDVTGRRRWEQQLRAMELERDQLLEDLHDKSIQAIYSIGLSLERGGRAVEREPALARRLIGEAAANLNLVIQDLRAHLGGTTPVASPDFRHEIEQWVAAAGGSGPSFTVEVDPSAAAALEPRRAMQLLAVAREGISNILRHAEARNAEVSLRLRDGVVILALSDDGSGLMAAGGSDGGLGLYHIAARVRRLQGDWQIASERGRGTRLLVQVPRST